MYGIPISASMIVLSQNEMKGVALLEPIYQYLVRLC